LIGLQYFLSESPYNDDQAELVYLEPIGQMGGKCSSMKLVGALDKVKTSYSSHAGVNAIKFKRGNEVVEFGEVVRDTRVTWKFEGEKTLVGLYGESSARGIEKLGMITLDLACQA